MRQLIHMCKSPVMIHMASYLCEWLPKWLRKCDGKNVLSHSTHMITTCSCGVVSSGFLAEDDSREDA